MTKKEIIAPFIVIGLAVLFAAICIIVFLTKGKSKKWIARKMKIGGLLLSLTAISSGTGCITCYDPPSVDIVRLNDMIDYEIKLNLDTGNVLTGTIYDITASSYSFTVEDELNETRQSDQIIPADGAIDSPEEEIKLEIDNTLPTGDYLLKVFAGDISEQENKNPIDVVTLSIVNE